MRDDHFVENLVEFRWHEIRIFENLASAHYDILASGGRGVPAGLGGRRRGLVWRAVAYARLRLHNVFNGLRLFGSLTGARYLFCTAGDLAF